MKGYKKNIVTFIIIYIVINLIFGYLKTIFWYNLKGVSNHGSESISSSKCKGAFIKELSIKPKEFILEGNKVILKDVWLEHANTIYYVVSVIPFVFEFPLYKNEDFYNICININKNIILDNLISWWFILKDKETGHPITHHEYFFPIDDINWEKKELLLTNNWKFIDSIKFEISK